MRKTIILVMVAALLFYAGGYGHAESEEKEMAVYREDIITIELESGSISRNFLQHSIGSGDAAANRFGVRVVRNGKYVDLTGVSCFGYFRNAEGTNIALTNHGTVDGNVAFVTLPQACYTVEGQFTLSIKLIGGGVTGTMRIVDGMVDNTNTGSPVAPTGDVPTYTEILAVYDQMMDTVTDYNETVAGQNAKITGLRSDFEEIAETVKSKNLLNPEGTFANGYISPTNGSFTESSDYIASDYIAVEGGNYFVASDNTGEYSECRFIAEYDADKQIIPAPAQTQGEGDGTHYKSSWMLLDDECAFVRVSIAAGKNKAATMWEVSTVNTPSEFATYFDSYIKIKDDALPENSPIMEWVEADNLLDGTTYTDGYVSATSGAITENASYTTSDYIAVEGGKLIISSSENAAARWFTVAQYDENQTVIVGTNERLSTLRLFDNTAYIRITYQKTEYATYKDLVLFQSTVNGYFANRYEIKPENIRRVYEYINEHAVDADLLNGAIKESPLYGKKVAWYGDSIIKNTWWNNLSTLFDMTSTNCGVGGTKISGTAAASMCQATRINGQYEDVEDPNTGEITAGGVAIPLDAEYIIIGAGTNDWAQNVPLGEKNLQYDANWDVVESVTTFYQACHVMFRRLCELRPNAKIIVLGTPFGRMANRDAFTNKYGILNNQGLSTLDYGNALCDVAEMWGFYAFRYGNKMGINDNNIATLLDPGGDGHLHPTTNEAKEMFRRVTLNCLLTIRQMP